MKTEPSKHDPASHLSLLVYGVDQTNFSLPHCTTHANDGRVHGLIFLHAGVLIHAALSQLMLSKKIADHITGAKHAIEAMHHVINDRAKCGPLPITFFCMKTTAPATKEQIRYLLRIYSFTQYGDKYFI